MSGNLASNGYAGDLTTAAKNNENFREVIFTGEFVQLVLMSLLVNEEIGAEVHHDIEQFIQIVEGNAKAIIGTEEFELQAGDAIVVPAGENHNVINTGDSKLKLITTYSPAEHRDGTIHTTKAEAEMDEHDHHE